MKILFKYFILCAGISFLFFSCSTKKEISIAREAKDSTMYYSLFTEATKYALLGDLNSLKKSVSLYNACIGKFPDNAAPYYQLSTIYYSLQDIKKAKSYGSAAVDRDDSNKWYLINLANIYQIENNLDSVIYLYKKIVEISDNPEYKYNLSVFYSKKGDVKNSMRIVEELEKDLPDAQEILILKYRNYNELHMVDSAIKQLEMLIKLFPDDVANYGLLAEYLSEVNRYSYAGEIYRSLLVIEPNNGLANISYGDFFLKQSQKDSALYYYKIGFNADDITFEDKAGIVYNFLYNTNTLTSDSLFVKSLIEVLIQKYPTDPRPCAFEAEYYLKRGDYSNGLVSLKKAIDNNAEQFIIYEQYCMVSNYMKLYQNVIDIAPVAMIKFPNELTLYIYSAFSYFQSALYDSAISICVRGEKKSETDKESYIQLVNIRADSYRNMGNHAFSDSLFEKILVMDPTNLMVRNNYAYYLSLRNFNLERAEELSRLTIQKEPKNPTYLDTYAWILFKRGNTKDALKYIEIAIKNGAHANAEVLDHYGDILFSLGQCKNAKEAWEFSLKYGIQESKAVEQKISNSNTNCPDGSK